MLTNVLICSVVIFCGLVYVFGTWRINFNTVLPRPYSYVLIYLTVGLFLLQYYLYTSLGKYNLLALVYIHDFWYFTFVTIVWMFLLSGLIKFFLSRAYPEHQDRKLGVVAFHSSIGLVLIMIGMVKFSVNILEDTELRKPYILNVVSTSKAINRVCDQKCANDYILNVTFVPGMSSTKIKVDEDMFNTTKVGDYIDIYPSNVNYLNLIK